MTKFTFFLYVTGMLYLKGIGLDQDSNEPGWYLYSGEIEKSPIILSLYIDKKNNLKGNICLTSHNDERIELNGKKTGENYTLDLVTSNPKFKNSKLTFTHAEKRSNNIIKDGELAGNDTSYSVRMTFKGYNPTSYERRYQLEQSNKQVEVFFKEIKTNIKNGQKHLLAELIAFPISVNLNNRTIRINNTSEFIKNYPQIFTAEFKRKIEYTCSCDLGANAQGVMLGEGIIWVFEDMSGKLKIIAINN